MTTQEVREPRILIVDDNPANLSVLFNYLDDMGFKVLIAPNGERALEQIQYERPDIILLDILMPNIDGFETCVRLKRNRITKDVPVIFITALTNTEDIVKGFEVGAVDYITKPFQQEEVLARINVHLTVQTLQSKLRKQNTQLRQQNQLLDEKNKELKILNYSKDRFFSILAHDLKTPFASFKLGVELLSESDKISPQKMQTLVDQLKRSANKMDELLENLLNWARVQMGTMKFEIQPLDLRTAVDACIYLLQSNFDQKEHQLINHIQKSMLLFADPNAINTVLRNLLTNAWKFTPRGGKIRISAEKEVDHFIKISIKDSGIGIDADKIDSLFQVDTDYRRKGTENESGTGLGLILCRELIEKHGGQIWVESEEGKGSNFIFTLPEKSLT